MEDKEIPPFQKIDAGGDEKQGILFTWPNFVGYHDSKALANGLKNCIWLQTLNLSSIYRINTKALSDRFIIWTNLQTLNFRHNGILNQGARFLANGLKHCVHLQTLDLAYNQIGDKGAKFLADSLKHCKLLQVLDLSYNCIDDDGALTRDLASVLKNCTIKLTRAKQDLNMHGSLKEVARHGAGPPSYQTQLDPYLRCLQEKQQQKQQYLHNTAFTN